MSQRDYSYRSAEQYPCPICGAKNYSWGKPIAERFSLLLFSGNVLYRANEGVIGGKKMRARKCNQCGNIQLFEE